jgi:hypothetical protein
MVVVRGVLDVSVLYVLVFDVHNSLGEVRVPDVLRKVTSPTSTWRPAVEKAMILQLHAHLKSLLFITLS